MAKPGKTILIVSADNSPYVHHIGLVKPRRLYTFEKMPDSDAGRMIDSPRKLPHGKFVSKAQYQH
jgi:hypothetical protein